jgi:hypothetical protein
MRPGANWDLSKGRPRTGDFVGVLSSELTAILTQSPIGAAFAQHGYRLHVDGLEHVEEDPKELPRPNAYVPTDILVIYITAQRDPGP